jgi:hypothetical protein
VAAEGVAERVRELRLAALLDRHREGDTRTAGTARDLGAELLVDEDSAGPGCMPSASAASKPSYTTSLASLTRAASAAVSSPSMPSRSRLNELLWSKASR